MKRRSIKKPVWPRVLVFGALPMVLGLGGVQYLKWTDAIWLTDAGAFWPYVLSALSIGILVRIVHGPYEDVTGAVAAWLVLLVTWFYATMWFGATKVPTAAALVGGNGHVTLVREAIRTSEPDVWLLTRRPVTRLVQNVSGSFTASGLDVSYTFTPSYVGRQAHGTDLQPRLVAAAEPILAAAARESRTSRIAFLGDRGQQDAMIARICRAVSDGAAACPVKVKMSPTPEAAAYGGVWSQQYSEIEAIEEKHLPSLLHLLTQTEVSLGKRDQLFDLLLAEGGSASTLMQLAQKSQLLTDEQFDLVVARILSSRGEDYGDAAAVVANANRLGSNQRTALRGKAIDEARLATLLAHSASLRLTDAEIVRIAPRVIPALRSNPALAVRAIDLFGDRLPDAAQRAAVDGILDGKASYALTALERLNFSPELRQLLLKKVLAEAALDDFTTVRLNKTKLLEMLTPQEMRALVAVAVRRGEGSDRWHAFSVETLPVSAMTPGERHQLVNGLVFNSPKAALEFVSKNRDFLDAREVADVTRDYSRTVTRDFCLHLSHRNKNWKQNYFSEAQLQIFRDCAEGK